MYCKQCGNLMNSTDKFCGSCGANNETGQTINNDNMVNNVGDMDDDKIKKMKNSCPYESQDQLISRLQKSGGTTWLVPILAFVFVIVLMLIILALLGITFFWTFFGSILSLAKIIMAQYFKYCAFSL